MHESRQSSTGAGVVLRKLMPPPVLCGFLLLLAMVFAVSYAAGSAAGPVAPGMHGTSDSTGGGGTGGTGDSGDTGDMGEMDLHGGGH
ncbi:hypothetical protein [Streptomyces sp. Root369]|uniref:hypothetical protein n=1 Tax=Streptomyces sp. Root369 TaxID=1736523 RepID=UPI00070EF606|nr:hypothetical protein [Streptomyces sp. Root369]KQV94266.1 hypothetical protein ASD08_14675 [Streptomyces sp. Root369]